MSIHTYFRSLSTTSTPRRSTRRPPPVSRLCCEPLEDRCLLSFSPAMIYSGGANPQALVTADFNADGRLDLAVSNGGANTVSVLLGNSDRTFQAALTSATGGSPGPLLAADLNGDGKMDLVTVNGGSSVLLGNGDGTFQPPSSVALPLNQTTTSAALGDLDADGKLDLVTGGWTRSVIVISDDPTDLIYEYHDDGYISVLLGNGDGTFGPGTAYHITNSIAAAVVAVADFNGDGRADVLANTGLFLSNADGTLQNSLPPSFGANGVVGDFDGDGTLDLLGWGVFMSGNGDGTFGPAQSIGVQNSPVVGDVNADGKLDAVTLARAWLGNGDGSFALPVDFDLGTSPNNGLGSPVLGDFDGNGFPDLAVVAPDYSYYDEYSDTYYYFPGFVVVALNDGIWTPPPPPPPSITISDVTVTEGNAGTRAASFTVSLSAANGQPVIVAYATANGTATADSDYQATSGTLTIPAGQTTGTITVLVKGDRLAEPNETFVVNLSSPTNATIADGQGVGTILDDEPRISINDMSKKEGKKGQTTLFTFTVTLSAAYDQAVTMSFRTVNGTAKTSDNDYIAKTGTLTFAPGETTKTITIEVKGDSKKEANETFYLDLFGNSSNALFTKNRGLGTILNDD